MQNSKKKKKVLVALSGGIDSAVSAYLLLKQGYEVEAAFMKNWSSTAGLKVQDCPWLVDRQDALRVAAFLRIPLHSLDFEEQYRKNVMKYFFEEYRKGRTPNPDVMCNKEIKFKLLYNWAIKNGFDFLATGHYAQVGESENRKNRRIGLQLLRSRDEFKDQTYFIYNIKTEQLPRVLFPIGGMKKSAVRSLARKLKLPNAEKRESMGLCFVGRIRLKDFLEQKLRGKQGNIIDQDGKAVGKHQGLYNYTIGQRQGIKVGATGPYYVFKKDLKHNVLYVTNDPNDIRLQTPELELHSVNWTVSPPFQGGVPTTWGRPLEPQSKYSNPSVSLRSTPSLAKGRSSAVLLGRYRHQGELVPLIISPISKGHYQVIFKTPQKAVASGQSLVLYRGKECVGGGIIA